MADDFRLLAFADPHLRSRTPPSRISYLSDFEAKWLEICTICHGYDVDGVVILGDVFSSLQGNVSHGLVSWIIREFKKCSVPIFVIPGNHDIRLDSDREHLRRRPLGVVIESGVVKLLTPKPLRFKGRYLVGSDSPMTIDRSIDNYLFQPPPQE